MKRQGIQDERVLAQRRKISSDAYSILMMALLLSIVIQDFFLDAPFQQYAVEFICFFGMSVYKLVRYWTLGLDLYSNEKKAKSLIWVNSLVCGFTVMVINGFFNYARYGQYYKEDGIGYFIAVLVITFFSATIPSFALMSFFNYINEKKQEKIKKQLDEEEENQ